MRNVIGIALALIGLCMGGGGIFLYFSEWAQIHGSMLALTLACVGTAGVFFGLHKTFWTSGGAKTVSLIAIALCLSMWGSYAIVTYGLWWMQMHMWWQPLQVVFVPLSVLIVTAVIGLMSRGLGVGGSVAMIVSLVMVGATYGGGEAVTIANFGKQPYLSIITGQPVVAVCEADPADPFSVAYPVWADALFCPLANEEAPRPLNPVADKALMKEWRETGRTPGENEGMMAKRNVCAAMRSQALTTAAAESDPIKKLQLAADAKAVRCDAVGDVDVWVATNGGWSAVLTPKNVIILLFILGMLAWGAETVAGLGKKEESGSAPHP